MDVTLERIRNIMDDSLEGFLLLRPITGEILYQNKLSTQEFQFNQQRIQKELLYKVEKYLYQKENSLLPDSPVRNGYGRILYCNISSGFLDGANTIIWVKITPISSKLQQKRLLEQDDSEIIFLEAVPRLYHDILFRVDLATRTLTHAGDLFLQFGLPRVMESYPDSLLEQGAIHPDDREVFRHFSYGLLEGETGSCSVRMRLLDNTFEWFSMETTAVLNANDEIVEILGKLTNIQGQKTLEERANFDTLTGTLHLKSFHTLVEESMEENEGAFFIVDVDGFDKVSVGFGHQFGDGFLQELGRRLNHCLRRHDLVGRIGADQFVFFFPKLNEHSFIYPKVKEILNIASKEMVIGEHKVSFTLSVGVAHYPLHGQSFDAVFQSAEKAMLSAKEDGGNRAYLCQMNEVYRVISAQDDFFMRQSAVDLLNQNASAFVIFHRNSYEIVSENKKARDMFFQKGTDYHLQSIFGSEEAVEKIVHKSEEELRSHQPISLFNVIIPQKSDHKLVCNLEFSYISDDQNYIYMKLTEKQDRKLELMRTIVERVQKPVVVLFHVQNYGISYGNSLFYELFDSVEETFKRTQGSHFLYLLEPRCQKDFSAKLEQSLKENSKGCLSMPLTFVNGMQKWLYYDSEKLRIMDSDKKIYCELWDLPPQR